MTHNTFYKNLPLLLFIFEISLLVLFASLFFGMGYAHAQSSIIPCGIDKGDPCNFCDLYDLLRIIIDRLLLIIIPLALLGIAVGAFIILSSGGSESKVSHGKEIIGNTIKGILIALIAWLIINTVMYALVDKDVNEGNFFNWYQFPTCGGASIMSAPGDTSATTTSELLGDEIEIIDITVISPATLVGSTNPHYVGRGQAVQFTWEVPGVNVLSECTTEVSPVSSDEAWSNYTFGNDVSSGFLARSGTHTSIINAGSHYNIYCTDVDNKKYSGGISFATEACEKVGGSGPINIVISAADINGCTTNVGGQECAPNVISGYDYLARNIAVGFFEANLNRLFSYYKSNSIGRNFCVGINNPIDLVISSREDWGFGSHSNTCGYVDANNKIFMNSDAIFGRTLNCDPLGTIEHEFAHAVAGLHDEYSSGNTVSDIDIEKEYLKGQSPFFDFNLGDFNSFGLNDEWGSRNCFAGSADLADRGLTDAKKYCSLLGDTTVGGGCLHASRDRRVHFQSTGKDYYMWSCGGGENLMSADVGYRGMTETQITFMCLAFKKLLPGASGGPCSYVDEVLSR